MAEGDDPSSRTEEPTSRRLEEARSRGEVAKSSDFAQWASFAGAAGAIAIAGGWMTRDLANRLLPFIAMPDAFDLEHGGAQDVLRLALLAAAPALAVVLSAAAISGVAGNVIQTGLLWSAERMKPDFQKVSPMSGFKRLFGIDGLVQFLRSVLKILITGAVAWWAVKPHLTELQSLSELDPAAILPLAAGILRSLALAVMVLLGLAAALDWFWQRLRFMQKMRMSREELKEEVRQSEGDPQIKARIRQLRYTRARQRMIQAVPGATVVVTNPTHFAIALKYEQGESGAPVCVAKGMDRIALKIREVAEEAGVPIVEDPPLARALYATVEVEEAIPLQHYEAVAKVIGFVLNAAKRRRG